MTDYVISDLIEPSEELLRDDGTIDPGRLLDEVDLYNLYDDAFSPEKDNEHILKITYPTSTLKAVIENTANKLDDNADLTEGAQVLGGTYGSGKSHMELVIYHLFNNPESSTAWLEAHDIDVTLPSETRTAALQMFNLTQDYKRLSDAVADYLGIDEWGGDSRLPTVHQIRDTLNEQPAVVIIDEFERWFGMQEREEYRDDNLAFLQNLLEAAGRDDTPLSVLISLLYKNDEVQAVTSRTNPFTHDLTARRDEKIQFIIHRLVGDYNDSDGIASVAKEYTDVYRQNGQIELTDYHDMQDRIERYYPFQPITLELLMDRYSEQEMSSDARGLLRFLAEIFRDNYDETDLILTGDINVYEYTNRFQYIDSQLVGKYINDYHRLQNNDGTFDQYIEELLNIVLIHSLARGGDEGANKRQMLLGVIRKGRNANAILQTFQDEVFGHAWHIHRINGEYAFDTDENPAARIEKKAQDIHKNDAIHRMESLVRDDLFDGRNNVYILKPVNTPQDIPDNKSLKIVVSLGAKENYDDEFEALTTGQSREFNNTLVLVTPKKRSSIDSNTGIRELARKVVAGEQLQREEDVLPDGFDDIHQQNYQNLRDRIRDKYGTVHTSTGHGLIPQDLPKGGNIDFYTGTINVVRPDTSQLRSEVKETVKEAGASGIQYEHLRNDFYRNTRYATLTEEAELRDAIDSLCKDGTLEVGNYYEGRVASLGNDTNLLHKQHRTTPEPDPDPDPTDSTPPGGGGGTGGGGGGDGPEPPEPDSDLVTHPPMDYMRADNKPVLIDDIEREAQGWDIHHIKILIEGPLSPDDQEAFGITDSSLSTGVTLDQTLELQPDDPYNHEDLISLLWSLKVPEGTEIKLKLQVDKNE